jgi:hypothetical protein
MQILTAWQTSLRARSQGLEWRPKPARVAAHSKYGSLCVESIHSIRLPNSCRTTGKSETIDSSVGLVPTNALGPRNAIRRISRWEFIWTNSRHFGQVPPNLLQRDCRGWRSKRRGFCVAHFARALRQVTNQLCQPRLSSRSEGQLGLLM